MGPKNKEKQEKLSKNCMQFVFSDEGLDLGRAALQYAANLTSGLIVVDEFGPLELEGRGWRTEVDAIVCGSPALILLVVRDELADRVSQIYSQKSSQLISCHQPDAIDRVIAVSLEQA